MWSPIIHMFDSRNFCDKSPSWFLEILKLSLLPWCDFQIFRNTLQQFIPNCPTKYVITSTNTSFNVILSRTDSLNWYISFNVTVSRADFSDWFPKNFLMSPTITDEFFWNNFSVMLHVLCLTISNTNHVHHSSLFLLWGRPVHIIKVELSTMPREKMYLGFSVWQKHGKRFLVKITFS